MIDECIVVCGWFENKNNRTLITKPSVLEKKKDLGDFIFKYICSTYLRTNQIFDSNVISLCVVKKEPNSDV